MLSKYATFPNTILFYILEILGYGRLYAGNAHISASHRNQTDKNGQTTLPQNESMTKNALEFYKMISIL